MIKIFNVSATMVFGLAYLAAAAPAHAQRAGTVRGGTIQCESTDNHYHRCAVPWRDARLIRRDSSAACVRGRSWGVDRRGLWVDRGCRARFAEVVDRRADHHHRRQRQHDPRPGYRDQRTADGWNRQIRLHCDSNDNRYHMCQVDLGRRDRARLVSRQSHARCVFNESWGFNRAGVWVSHGCRGTFVVDRRR